MRDSRAASMATLDPNFLMPPPAHSHGRRAREKYEKGRKRSHSTSTKKQSALPGHLSLMDLMMWSREMHKSHNNSVRSLCVPPAHISAESVNGEMVDPFLDELNFPSQSSQRPSLAGHNLCLWSGCGRSLKWGDHAYSNHFLIESMFPGYEFLCKWDGCTMNYRACAPAMILHIANYHIDTPQYTRN